MALLAAAALLPWPLSTFAALSLTPPAAPGAPPPAKRFAAGPILSSPWDHFVLTAAAAWKVLFAAAALWAVPYDAAAAAALAPRWVAAVAARDVLAAWATGGLWDWLHLSPWSPAFAALQPVKFRPEPPRAGQLPHDFCWATVSALVAAAWEVLISHAYATGRLAPRAVPRGAWWADAQTVILLLTLPYVQIVHFHAVHRVMHAWCARRRRGPCARLPDVGAFLYRHVHALHHKSRDPTAFSGISMHPVESALFFTTMPLYALLGAHPIVVAHAKMYNIVVAMIGHESFGAPSTGGHMHWLHHQLVDCNYGGTFVPLDWLCGTFARDEDDFAAQRAAAEEADKGA